MERSKTIFGNDIAARDYAKAVNQQQKVITKYGDDSHRN